MPQPPPLIRRQRCKGKQAIGAWQHWMSSLYGLESDVYDDQQFSARLNTFELGAVGMTKIEASRHRVRRTGQHGQSQHGLPQDRCPGKGTASVCQKGRQAHARSGQWLIYDSTQEYEVLNPEWCELPDHHPAQKPLCRAWPRRGCADGQLCGRHRRRFAHRAGHDACMFAEYRRMGQGVAQHVRIRWCSSFSCLF